MRLIVLLLAGLVVAACDRQKPQAEQAEAAAPVPTQGVDRSHKGKPAPDVVFRDPDGGEISIADFRGVPVVVNLWATWCAPCVKELPTLDKVAEAHASEGALGLIAVSQDKAPQGSVEAFLDRLAIEHLGAYHDPDMKLSSAFGVEILPTTILIDAEGREIWRYVGDLDWTGKEARPLLAEAGTPNPEAAR